MGNAGKGYRLACPVAERSSAHRGGGIADGLLRLLRLALRVLHCDGAREEDVVFEVDVLVQILLELVEAAVVGVIGGAGAKGRRKFAA